MPRRGKHVVLSIGFANCSLAKPRDAHTAPKGAGRGPAYIAQRGNIPLGPLFCLMRSSRAPKGQTRCALRAFIAEPKGRAHTAPLGAGKAPIRLCRIGHILLLPLRGNDARSAAYKVLRCPEGAPLGFFVLCASLSLAVRGAGGARRGPEGVVLYRQGRSLALPRDAHTLAPLGQEQSGRQRGPFGHILPILERGHNQLPKGAQRGAYNVNTIYAQRAPFRGVPLLCHLA